MLKDFHISFSLTWAFIWLTESILNLTSIDLLLIWSLILDPFKALRSLFWHFCKASKSLFVGSESVYLTQPRSWRPYLSLERKRPWLILRMAASPIEFFSLQMKKSLWFRLDKRPPVPWFTIKIVHKKLIPIKCNIIICVKRFILGKIKAIFFVFIPLRAKRVGEFIKWEV